MNKKHGYMDMVRFIVLNGKQFYRLQLAKFGYYEEKILNYYSHGDHLFLKELMVPKPNERRHIVQDIHLEIGNFNDSTPLQRFANNILGTIGLKKSRWW